MLDIEHPVLAAAMGVVRLGLGCLGASRLHSGETGSLPVSLGLGIHPSAGLRSPLWEYEGGWCC